LRFLVELEDYKNSSIWINNICINAKDGTVKSEGSTEIIEPKVMSMLLVLCQSPKEVVSAESLFEQVWPNAIYSPNSVRRNIALLRQALKDNDKTLIKTHPKRGYSLEANIKFDVEQNDKTTVQKNTKKKPLLYFLAICIAGLLCILVLGYLSYGERQASISLNGLQPITTSSENEHFFSMSPSGEHIAIVQSDSQNQRYSILIKDLITNKSRLLLQSNKRIKYLEWDKHNHGIIYSFANNKGIVFNRILLDQQLAFKSEEKLFKRKDISWNSPFFIDDKQNLFYLANLNGSDHSRKTSLYKHNLSSGSIEKLLESNELFKPYKIALSSNYTQIALIGFDKEGTSEVKLLTLRGKLKTIRKIDKNWHFINWLPDGKSLILSNGSQLKQLNVNGEIKTLSYQSFNFLLYPQVAPNSDKILFIENIVDSDIYLSNFAKEADRVEVANSNNVEWAARLSPDGKAVVYISAKIGYPQLFVKQLATNKETLVFDNENREYAIAPPIWGFDGKKIVSAVNNKIFTIELTEYTSEITWFHELLGVPKAFLHSDDEIIFVDKRDANDKLVKANLSTSLLENIEFGPYQDVGVNQMNQVLIAQDNKVINLSRDEAVVSLPGKIIKLLSKKDGLFIVSQSTKGSQLSYFDFQSRNVTMVPELNLQGNIEINDISSGVVLYSTKQTRSDVLSLNIKE